MQEQEYTLYYAFSLPRRSERERPRKASRVSVPWSFRFDRTSSRQLAVLVILFTAIFATIYGCLTHSNGENGVHDATVKQEAWPWAIEDGLFFSIGMETTVGGANLTPHGISRIFACVQVLGGLAIGGLIVSRLTTSPDGKVKILIKRISGSWGEISLKKDQGFIVSLISIRYANGLLRYDGMNYNERGQFLGTFEGSSSPTNLINGSEIVFDYSNEEGDRSYFSLGKTTLCFQFPEGLNPRLDGRGLTKYDFFSGEAKDKDHQEEKIKMVGYRLEKIDDKVVRSTRTSQTSKKQRSDLALKIYRDFESDHSRRKAKWIVQDERRSTA